MFKSTTGLKTDDFQALFGSLDISPGWQNIKVYDGRNNKTLKCYPQDCKSAKKAKLPAINHFF